MTAQLDALGIVVDDMARSLAFYRELGLDVPPEADEQPHAEAALPGGLRVLFDTAANIQSFDPDWQPSTEGRHRLELAFRLDSPAEVDSLYDKLVSLGYQGHKEPWDAVWGQRYAMIHDPDGNSVSLFADRGAG
ncbi:MAG TPA: VOC family protein [Acidimicrobiales bacterium]|jgi:catechol 2,3-dioxygenase-like lactoylglutathione lyase family enzyme